MINISKISGVLFVQENTREPKSYFGQSGKYVFADDETSVIVNIGGPTPNSGDVYDISFSDLRVNGQTPTSVENAKVLLNAVFGN